MEEPQSGVARGYVPRAHESAAGEARVLPARSAQRRRALRLELFRFEPRGRGGAGPANHEAGGDRRDGCEYAMKHKDFIEIHDLTAREVMSIFKLARLMKAK